MLTWVRVVDYVLDGHDDHLLAWLRRELPSATSLWLRTGFFTASGLSGVEPDLADLLDRGGRVVALLGGSPLQLELAALRELIRLSDDFPGGIDVSVVLAPDFQNAKTYVLEHIDGHWSAWVGSANLTNGGMVSNYETAVVFDSRDDGEAFIERLREAQEAVMDAATSRRLDRRLLRKLQFDAQVSRLGAGRTDVSLPDPLEDLLQGTMDKLDRITSHGPVAEAVTTGLSDLDATLSGLIPGSFTVIASRAGVGRTTLALTMLRAAAIKQRVPAAIFTFDMLKDEVVQRVVSAEARIRLMDMRSGRMSDDDWTRMASTMIEISEAPLFIEAGSAPDLDSPSRTIIESASVRGLGLVVVDPLSAIVARSFANNRERESAEVGRRLKSLAMELEVPIVGCADLGRSVEFRTDKRPRPGDLGDGDALAHTADSLILLHRPDYYERDDPRAGEMDLVVVKNRHGPENTVTVAHQLHYSRLVDLTCEAP